MDGAVLCHAHVARNSAIGNNLASTLPGGIIERDLGEHVVAVGDRDGFELGLVDGLCEGLSVGLVDGLELGAGVGDVGDNAHLIYGCQVTTPANSGNIQCCRTPAHTRFVPQRKLRSLFLGISCLLDLT